MPFLPGSNSGTTNGTANVVVVASPVGAVQRIVRVISVHNRDTAQAGVTLVFRDGANSRILKRILLLPEGTLDCDTALVLDTAGKRIEVVLDAAVATNELDWVTSWGDKS